MSEQQAIEQLSSYRQMQARIKVLSTYSVGAGITVSRLNQEDQLQDLHRRLRGLPSYMYLSTRELRLEQVANAYMTRHPAGVKSQLAAVPTHGVDDEDSSLLQELRAKIAKVVAARGYDIRDDLDAVLDRLVELQELQDTVSRIDTVLAALEQYKPDYARLLQLKYMDGLTQEQAAESLNINERTVRRRRNEAEKEFVRLMS
ncbi:RNA polymerase subunit sigma-24 [Paenibacillus oenotherae]|uniref:RNA polymerase subunit sigma-24 n=1 Tax=Paenibacillus oenotherae TaxID=1435645 RepID=A0ABS7D7M4_9BACL|nr:sigma factor-like helix-turn-helix DNA-binding protein [Paenibacillus oenotherae]MBW7475937.1 RNA polymerase subunit sigma-24 [Paenibacillus oenotherae]